MSTSLKLSSNESKARCVGKQLGNRKSFSFSLFNKKQTETYENENLNTVVPPHLQGHIQDPQWIPETVDSTQHDMYYACMDT